MEFRFKIHSGGEVRFAGIPRPDRPVYYGGPPPESGSWKLDMARLEDYINQRIAGLDLGASVTLFILGFEIADLEGWGDSFSRTRDYVSYRPAMKAVVSVAQLNWPDVKDLDAGEQLRALMAEMDGAAARVLQMKRKPRDFDVEAFRKAMAIVLVACPLDECIGIGGES